MGVQVTEGKLGDENKFYYDNDLKCWRVQGEEAPPPSGPPPPPPKITPQRSVSGSLTAGMTGGQTTCDELRSLIMICSKF